MTNRSSSKQHCLVGNIRPKKTGARKRNKAKARARRLASQGTTTQGQSGAAAKVTTKKVEKKVEKEAVAA